MRGLDKMRRALVEVRGAKQGGGAKLGEGKNNKGKTQGQG